MVEQDWYKEATQCFGNPEGLEESGDKLLKWDGEANGILQISHAQAVIAGKAIAMANPRITTDENGENWLLDIIRESEMAQMRIDGVAREQSISVYRGGLEAQKSSGIFRKLLGK